MLGQGLAGVQDIVVFPGAVATLTLSCVDPEGYPTTLCHRSDQVGSFSGQSFSWATSSTTSAGDYPLSVLCSDGTGGTSSKDMTVTVSSTIAEASASTVDGPAPLSVSFSSTGSADVHGSTLTWVWDFDDGTSSTAASPAHVFSQPGLYQVALTATGPLGSHTAHVVVEARNASWPLRVNNGWTSTGLDATQWTVLNPSQGTISVAAGVLTVNCTTTPNCSAPNYGIQTQATLTTPFYLETDYRQWYGQEGDGIEILGSRIGWYGTYNSPPMSLASLTTTSYTIIGQETDNGLRGPELMTMRVYVTADPNHPGMARTTGYLDVMMGPYFFRVDNQPFSADSLRLDACFRNSELHRFQVWSP